MPESLQKRMQTVTFRYAFTKSPNLFQDLSFHLSTYLSFHISRKSIYLSIHLTVYVSISLSIDLSFYVSIFRYFSYLYIHIFIYTHMFISICIYIYIYSDPKVDRIFFGGCGIYVAILLDVGQRKKQVVGIWFWMGR